MEAVSYIGWQNDRLHGQGMLAQRRLARRVMLRLQIFPDGEIQADALLHQPLIAKQAVEFEQVKAVAHLGHVEAGMVDAELLCHPGDQFDGCIRDGGRR